MIFFAQCTQQRICKAGFIRAGLPAGNRNGTFIYTQPLVRNHQVNIKLHLIAQPGTFRTGAERIVEGKASGLNLADTDAAVRTGKTLAEGHGFSSDNVHHQQPLRQIQDILNGIRQPALDARLYCQTVHHYLDIMLDVLLQGNFLSQFVEISIDAHAHIAAPGSPLQHLLVPALPSPDHRRQKLQPGSLGKRHNLVYHLVHCLL